MRRDLLRERRADDSGLNYFLAQIGDIRQPKSRIFSTSFCGVYHIADLLAVDPIASCAVSKRCGVCRSPRLDWSLAGREVDVMGFSLSLCPRWASIRQGPRPSPFFPSMSQVPDT